MLLDHLLQVSRWSLKALGTQVSAGYRERLLETELQLESILRSQHFLHTHRVICNACSTEHLAC